mgnify:CR=1 FL=1
MPADVQSIRPFRVHVPDTDLAELRRRIAATRWPDKETVADASQGAPLARLQELVRYWGNGYDWRNGGSEAQRTAAIHDEHRRGGHSLHSRPVERQERDAACSSRTVGPAPVFEFLKVRSDHSRIPSRMAAAAADAFDVVIPSIPGYGFSGQPTSPGWGPEHVARRLGRS